MSSNLIIDVFKFLSVRPAIKQQIKKCEYIFDRRFKGDKFNNIPKYNQDKISNFLDLNLDDIEKNNTQELKELRKSNEKLVEGFKELWIRYKYENKENIKKEEAILLEFRRVLTVATENFSRTKLYDTLEAVMRKCPTPRCPTPRQAVPKLSRESTNLVTFTLKTEYHAKKQIQRKPAPSDSGQLPQRGQDG